MNSMRTRLAAVTLFALLWARPALAVIAAKTPPSSMFNESRAVVLGRITKVFPDTGVIEASATALSGESPADTIKIKIDNLPETLKAAKEGLPIILFLGKRAASSALRRGGWRWRELRRPQEPRGGPPPVLPRHHHRAGRPRAGAQGQRRQVLHARQGLARPLQGRDEIDRHRHRQAPRPRRHERRR